MKVLRLVLAAFFSAAGILHFVRPEPFEAIVPPFVPLAHEAVLVSGVAEIAGGLALLSERTRPYAFWWLTALLIAVFPANIYMAVAPEEIRGLPQTDAMKVALWLRLPLQPLLVYAVWRSTRPEPGRPAGLRGGLQRRGGSAAT
ncbi:hypothetical protein HJD18_09565 [Thermoleophilia bacterium SCSIO 60948]|nr:hypothetical protein HJD18_09565 [Thermoleophilia bacterium SCSIO 60948]